MTNERLAKAQKYYDYALSDIILASGERYSSWNQFINQFKSNFGLQEGLSVVHSYLLLVSLRKLVATSGIDIISDTFSQPYIKPTRLLEIPSLITGDADINQTVEKLGPAAPGYLRDVFFNIAATVTTPEAEQYHNQALTQLTSGNGSVAEKEMSEHAVLADDGAWSPLKIDRSTSEYEEAINYSEAALREVESSNGYADSEPDERNAIVSTIKGTIDAIKSGSPSKKSIVHSLLKPLQYLAVKFRDASIGEIAKVAAVKLVAWLSTLL